MILLWPLNKGTDDVVKILRRKDVEEIVGLSRSTIYKLMSTGAFPRSIRLGPRAVGWRLPDIEAWIEFRASDVG